MRHQRDIFLIALGCSVWLHLASLGIYVGYDRLHDSSRAVASAKGATSRPATVAQQDEIIVYPDMGDDAGTGIGSNNSPGDRPLQARQADEDQALLSRDAEGSGRIGAAPSKWKGPTGDGSGGTPAVVATAIPAPQPDAATPPTPAVHDPSLSIEKSSDAAAEPVKPPIPTPDSARHEPSQAAQASPPQTDKRTEVAMVLPAPDISSTPRQAQADPLKPVEAPKPEPTPTPTPPTPKPPAPTPPLAVAPSPETGDGHTRGLPIASADPLPQSDSDSDPFSRLSGTVIFHDGRLDVRMGRKIKTTRPQVRIAGQIDMIALNNPTVVLEVHIARTGNVTDVKIAHSSGSNQIDEPTRLAVYDWWFEPVKDKKGNAISDVIFFSVQFL